jgi:hypothetical protein
MRFRNILPVLLAITAITSCSVYRSGQTPDDVYYSPGRSADDSYLTVDNPRKGRSYGRYDNTDPNDNYLRMRQYGSRWSTFDDYNDWQYNGGYYGMYSPYTPYSSFYNVFGYGGYMGYGAMFLGSPFAYYNPWSYNSYFNSVYYWNSYYNPYAYGIVVGGAKTNPTVYQSVRNFNMRSYTNVNYSTRNVNGGRPIYTNQNGRYSTSNNNNGNGNSNGLRRVYRDNNNGGWYTPNQRTSTPTYSPPVRTYSPSGGGGGGSIGGGGGGGGRPSRGH